MNSFLTALLPLVPYMQLVISGFFLILFFLYLVSFFIAGKATDSINDEFSSAFTLLGMMLLISLVSGVIKGVLSLFIAGVAVPALLAGLFCLVITIYVISKVYDLSPIKAILFLIISVLIPMVFFTLIALGIKFFAPEIFNNIQQGVFQEELPLDSVDAPVASPIDSLESIAPKIPVFPELTVQ